MSEHVGYEISAGGFRSDTELDGFRALLHDFNGDGYFEEAGESPITYVVPNGRRWFGLSCEEIVRDRFGKWFDRHPYVSATFRFTYFEHVPVETLTFDEGRWVNDGCE